MDPSDARQIMILVLLIALSAFFSSMEAALTSVNKIRIRGLADEGVKKAKTVNKLIEEPSKMLRALQISSCVVNLTAAAIVTILATNHYSGFIVSLIIGIVVLLLLILGEIVPKSFAILHAEKLSLMNAGVVYLLMLLLTPVIFVVNKITLAIQLLLRVDPDHKDSAITESELRTIVDFSHEEGIIESEERQMITNVVDFGDSYAKDVMVPHVDMAVANINYTYAELVLAFEKDKFSRLPVYDGSRDNVVGIVNLKDVFFYKGSKNDFSIAGIMREPYFTYEFQKTPDLMRELRKASSSMAIVLDEYGSTAGLITLEDLLEEIVGEIRDEYDTDEVDAVQKISDYEYMAEGTARLDEVNEATGLSLESDDYDSIAGHIICLLEHLPKTGEYVTEGNVTYTVKAISKNRIDKIHIRIEPDDLPAAE